MKLILDRVEEGLVAVLTDECGKVYECSANLLPGDYRENDAFLGGFDAEGKVISLEKCENRDSGKNKKRLRALFDKSKNIKK